MEDEYLPAGQFVPAVKLVVRQYWPAGHGVAMLTAAPAQVEPAGQARHTEAPEVGAYVPATQFVPATMLAVAQYWPVGHRVAVLPVTEFAGQMEPMGQGRHAEAPAAEYLPEPH